MCVWIGKPFPHGGELRLVTRGYVAAAFLVGVVYRGRILEDKG